MSTDYDDYLDRFEGIKPLCKEVPMRPTPAYQAAESGQLKAIRTGNRGGWRSTRRWFRAWLEAYCRPVPGDQADREHAQRVLAKRDPS